MKFGETLYQRSIPQWAPYNVDYNSLKRLIKQRTTEAATEPVSIPGQGPSQSVWQPLDDELFPVLKHEHDRSALFIRSKLGEISRRLTHVERQAQLVEQKPTTATSRPIQQTRKYQKLVEEADGIGNDIEALSRFASAQRLAFRKILKKYKKWTGSTGLHIRMNNEVLSYVSKEEDEVLGRSRNALNPDMSPYLLQLNEAIANIQSVIDRKVPTQKTRSSSMQQPAPEIPPSFGCLDLERALITTSDSQTKLTYWVHNENLDEVKVLLMRRLRPWSSNGGRKGSTPKDSISSIVLLDDHRGSAKDGNVALANKVARWSDDESAYIRHQHRDTQTLEGVRRKDLLRTLGQSTSPEFQAVALIKSTRECFAKDDNKPPFASLETNIQIGNLDHTTLEDVITSGNYPVDMSMFPYSVLTINYVDARTVPKIVHTLNNSHLVQLVPHFSLESHAMYTQVGHPEDPLWKATLEADIRKVPAAISKKKPRRGIGHAAATSSGPSSTEGQGSIFSRSHKHSSQASAATSTDTLPSPLPTKEDQKDKPMDIGAARHLGRKRKSYGAVQAEAPQRYWNEFDDDPDFNGEETYTLYVTPDEPFQFPGTETISKTFGAMYQSLRSGKRRVLSWLPLAKNQKSTSEERTGLLSHTASPSETDRDADVESSSDDNLPVKNTKANRLASRGSRRGASRTHFGDYSSLGYPRRSSRDQLLSYTSIGLHLLSWMFLIMATVLKSTGRRKAAIEVDAAVVSGIVIAVACGMFAVGCTLARRISVSTSEWTVVSLLVVCEVAWGVCLGLAMIA